GLRLTLYLGQYFGTFQSTVLGTCAKHLPLDLQHSTQNPIIAQSPFQTLWYRNSQRVETFGSLCILPLTPELEPAAAAFLAPDQMKRMHVTFCRCARFPKPQIVVGLRSNRSLPCVRC